MLCEEPYCTWEPKDLDVTEDNVHFALSCPFNVQQLSGSVDITHLVEKHRAKGETRVHTQAQTHTGTCIRAI